MRLLANGQLTDAFALYRATLERLPSMVSIHDSVARIYETTGHADWAAQERAEGTPRAVSVCTSKGALRISRRPLSIGAHRRARRHDPESRYWRARAATELALAAFKHLDQLADSGERRGVRATLARGEEPLSSTRSRSSKRR